MLEKYKTPPQKLHIRYKNAKRKLEIASQMCNDSQNLFKRTPVIIERSLVPPPRKHTPSKKQYQKLDNLSSKSACLEKNSYFKISKLKQELKVTKKIHLCDKKNCKLATETFGEKCEGFYPLKFSTPAKSFPVFMWLDYRSV